LEKERAIIFIDHANVFKNLEIVDGRINWRKFKKILAKNHHLVGAFVYIGVPNPIPKDQRRFIKYLKHVGYVVQLKPIQETSEGKKKQKGIDVFMYKEIVELAEADAYDKAIIVSGDADFIDAVRKLKELNKEFVIWSFKISLAQKLIEEAGGNNIHYIDYILDDIKVVNSK